MRDQGLRAGFSEGRAMYAEVLERLAEATRDGCDRLIRIFAGLPRRLEREVAQAL